ncbi:hypothetical protein E3T50_08535 [Cryobacterium gelidum]|uniref:Transposase IS4-like domain-containing protein n=1 Tax=Cryobacterium gelidum TaxID=1259164 RepID=A0A4V3IU58_9MICO|nr:hypothetical protein E3T50_08535 [Cryobacterium gelidum]
MIPTSGTRRQSTTPVTVRVVDYTIDDGRDNPDPYRLLTTILDPAEASAEELATVYSERWEIETVFDELKTYQRGLHMVLRSKSPAPVKQEIWGQTVSGSRVPSWGVPQLDVRWRYLILSG